MAANETGSSKRTRAQNISVVVGLVIFALILIVGSFTAINFKIISMAAIAFLMAFYWMSNAIPLAATSLFPVVLYPLFSLTSGKAVTAVYMNSTIFLFLGGFLIALAMEKWELHKRMALTIVSWFGGSPMRLLFGFMTATFFLSMWISNTATAIMMVAIGLAIIEGLEETEGKRALGKFPLALMLGIAYSASIGGMATLVGTPPNLAFSRLFTVLFPAAPEVSFGTWLFFALPLALTLLVVFALILGRGFFKLHKMKEINSEHIKSEKEKLPKATFEEKVVFVVFIATAALWTFRKDLVIGNFSIPGWSGLFSFAKFIDDGTIAVMMGTILFLIPARSKKGTENILDGRVFNKLPWATLLLFGGGFALAKGFKVSGLAAFIGEVFQSSDFGSGFGFVVVVTSVITFLTELTSNTATTEMILPVLASVSKAVGIHPLLLMIPTTLAASCAFMLPAATPPNAIVFGSGKVTIKEMAKYGFILNLTSIFLISLFVYMYLPAVYGIDFGLMPEWSLK